MDCILNESKSIKSDSIFKTKEGFRRALAQGHFYALFHEKQRELNQYLKAYNEISNKDSFKAEYIASLIYLLNLEVEELQNLI